MKICFGFNNVFVGDSESIFWEIMMSPSEENVYNYIYLFYDDLILYSIIYTVWCDCHKGEGFNAFYKKKTLFYLKVVN